MSTVPHPFLLSLLVLVSIAPLAPATSACQAAGAAYVCAGDFETGCSSSTGANVYVGSLSPLAMANLAGTTHRCSSAEAVTASLWVGGQSVAVRWWDGATCYHELRAAGSGQQVACAAGGPPNPGWGSVLP